MSDEDIARRRFLIIQSLRWMGALFALVGLAIVYRKLDLPREVGYALFVLGLADALIMPTVLARLWKSQKP